MAYKFELPAGSQTHNVFHVSLLKKFVGLVPLPVMELPPVSEDTSTTLPRPECVLDRRIVRKGAYRSKTEILVKWAGAPQRGCNVGRPATFLKVLSEIYLCGQGSSKGEE